MFTSRSRVMLIAAHPDDESLACSVLLQRAVRAAAAIRVVYLTDGENNPWPQRVLNGSGVWARAIANAGGRCAARKRSRLWNFSMWARRTQLFSGCLTRD